MKLKGNTKDCATGNSRSSLNQPYAKTFFLKRKCERFGFDPLT